ncbi:MAG: prepilin-type N-terminal cleavage/methylation domain-containing protein [Ruminococcus sp.]|nr:prepilin-type N-terminal cleavage/methylation domain-containing protein [Ruminococcus sp.]
MNTQVKNNKKGFTLVELVVVIAILAILAAIAIPVVTSVINSASKSTAASNASTIELAIKEAKADIVARNTETFGDTVFTPADMTIAVVAEKKAIMDAFTTKNYNNVDYTPFWNNETGKVVFLNSDSADMDGVEGYDDVVSLLGTTGEGDEATSTGAPDTTTSITELQEPADADADGEADEEEDTP